jgi:hypothetical protein
MVSRSHSPNVKSRSHPSRTLGIDVESTRRPVMIQNDVRGDSAVSCKPWQRPVHSVFAGSSR